MRYGTKRTTQCRPVGTDDRLADRAQPERLYRCTLALGTADQPAYECDLDVQTVSVPVASSIRFGAMSSTDLPRARATSDGMRN